MPTFPENEGVIQGNRAALRRLMESTAREAVRRYKMNPRAEYEGAVTGAVSEQMSIIYAGGGIDLLPFIRESCAHMWISTERHVCADCGEIGSDS